MLWVVRSEESFISGNFFHRLVMANYHGGVSEASFCYFLLRCVFSVWKVCTGGVWGPGVCFLHLNWTIVYCVLLTEILLSVEVWYMCRKVTYRKCSEFAQTEYTQLAGKLHTVSAVNFHRLNTPSLQVKKFNISSSSKAPIVSLPSTGIVLILQCEPHIIPYLLGFFLIVALTLLCLSATRKRTNKNFTETCLFLLS